MEQGWRIDRERRAGQWGLLLLGLIVYLSAFGFDFVNLDDNSHLQNNPYLSPGSPNWLALWREPYKALYIPLTYTVWGLFSGVGFPPFLLHSINIFLHLFTGAFLVYRLINLWLKDSFAAFWGALLFTLHPLQCESVSWVSGLKDVLSGCLSVAALLFLAKSSLDRRPSSARLLFSAATFFFVLAILAKPSAVVVPVIGALAGVFILQQTRRTVITQMGLWLLIAFPILALTLQSQATQHLPFDAPGWSQRLVVAADAIGFYIAKLVWPFGLAVDYGRSPGFVPDPLTPLYLSLAGLAVLLLILAYRHPRTRIFSVALLMVGVALSPVLGFKPFIYQTTSTVADRYLYLAFVPLGLAFGWSLKHFTGSSRARMAILSGLALFWATLSFNQSQVWKNSEALFTNVLAVNPRSWLAYNNLASVYEGRGEIARALAHYHQSVALHPHVPGFSSIAFLEMQQERPQAAREALETGLAAGLDHPALYYNLSVAHSKLGNTEQAQRYALLARQRDPRIGTSPSYGENSP